jgi:hypothetical protein
MRDKRERNQSQNRERTEKKQRSAAHLFPDYQPLNRTNPTPKKRAESEESET